MTQLQLALFGIGETKAALERLPPGTATWLYRCHVERSLHNQYRVNSSQWMQLKLAAQALYTIDTQSKPMPSKPAASIEPIYPPGMLYAISTSGPHAYLLCLGANFPQEHLIKEAEFRRWPTNLRDVIILIHVYTSKRFDNLFASYGIDPALAPKSSIIGAGAIVDCEYQPASGQYAHIYSTPVLFDQPITGVPGKHKYWQPQPDEPHLIKAFNQAWTDLTQTT